jgi:hypothetical protein
VDEAFRHGPDDPCRECFGAGPRPFWERSLARFRIRRALWLCEYPAVLWHPAATVVRVLDVVA